MPKEVVGIYLRLVGLLLLIFLSLLFCLNFEFLCSLRCNPCALSVNHALGLLYRLVFLFWFFWEKIHLQVGWSHHEQILFLLRYCLSFSWCANFKCLTSLDLAIDFRSEVSWDFVYEEYCRLIEHLSLVRFYLSFSSTLMLLWVVLDFIFWYKDGAGVNPRV